jgi:hypothetical protein
MLAAIDMAITMRKPKEVIHHAVGRHRWVMLTTMQWRKASSQSSNAKYSVGAASRANPHRRRCALGRRSPVNYERLALAQEVA